MKRVYVNEDWCLGCRLCEYNCAFSATGGMDMADSLRGLPHSPRVRVSEHGTVVFAVSCRHCEEPLCVAGCISGALRREDGIIRIDREKCVGCGTCVASCPYGAIMLGPNGAAQKCELCSERADKTPACVAGCPNAALVFEDRDQEGA